MTGPADPLSPRQIAAERRRDVDALTRRDVALELLRVPAAVALDRLDALREDLAGHDVTFSEAFWRATAAILERVGRREATRGEVDRWLETTGTHPAAMIGLLVWEEEGQREFVAEDVHRGLVAHLEQLVDDGVVDPDALLADDVAAWEAWRQAQDRWLAGPYDAGRSRMDAVIDEEDHAVFTHWQEADAANLNWLDSVLDPLGPVECPDDDVAAASASLRQLLAGDDFRSRLLRAASGLRKDALPADDHELWLVVAAGALAPEVGPDDGPLSDEEAASWLSLTSSEHVAALGAVLQRGPGAEVTPASLAGHVVADEDDDGADDFLDPFDPSAERASLEVAFHWVVEVWELLGAVRDGRLTRLGHWGLREAANDAFSPTLPD